MKDYIMGRNSVQEALRSSERIERIFIAKEMARKYQSLETLAQEQQIPVELCPVKKIDRDFGEGHQGVVALVKGVTLKKLEDFLDEIHEEPLVVVLDGIEDPHNMGAIIRSAECAGIDGLLFSKRHNAPVNSTVSKTSAGAVEHVPLVEIGNVRQALQQLKKKGYWIFGAHMEGDSFMDEADLTGPVALVIGNEGKGLSRIVKEECDLLISIPMYGQLNSLNASVAAALLMYEARRQRASQRK